MGKASSSDSDDDAPVAKHKSSGMAEQKVVDEICAVSGMRTAVTRAELKDFVARSKNFDASTMGELLQGKLGTNDWKVKLKALAAIEAVAKGDIGQYFVQQCPDDITEHLSSAQTTLKNQAQNTCAALGLDSNDSDDSESEPEEAERPAPSGPLFSAEPAPKADKKEKKSSKADKKADKEARKAERKKNKAAKAEPAASGGGGMFSKMTICDDEESEDEELPAQVEPAEAPYQEPPAVYQEPEDSLMCMDEVIAPKPVEEDVIALEDLFGDAPSTSQTTSAPGYQGMPQATMPMGAMSQMGQQMQQQMMQQQMMQQQYMMQQRQQQHMAMQPSMTQNGISFAVGQQSEGAVREQARQKSKFNFIGDTVKKEAGQ